MLKHRTTYEIMHPEDVGLTRTELVLGKHSGRHALRQRIADMGYTIDDSQLDEVFEEFKRLCDKKKEIFDADIEALVEKGLHSGTRAWELVSMHTAAGSACVPSATVTLRRSDGREFMKGEFGDGPIDAIFRAMESITGYRGIRLTDYQVRSVTGGKDALGEVYVEIKHEGRVYRARSVSTDIVEASAIAILNAINRIAAGQSQREPAEATHAKSTVTD
jgi:2-isopropylmalate synthase